MAADSDSNAARAVPAAARAWNAVLAIVIAAAFITQVVLLVRGGTDANSGSSGTSVGVGVRLGRLLSYFTIESNLIVLAVAITLVIAPYRDGRVWRVVRLDSLLGIVITGLVFIFVLADQVHLTGAAQWANIGFHYFAPLWTLVGWMAFGPRPRITLDTIAPAFIWPVLWIGYTFVHGAATGWYPYPFLDAGDKGYATAVVNTAVVVVIGVILALAFAWLDRYPDLRRMRRPDPFTPDRPAGPVSR